MPDILAYAERCLDRLRHAGLLTDAASDSTHWRSLAQHLAARGFTLAPNAPVESSSQKTSLLRRFTSHDTVLSVGAGTNRVAAQAAHLLGRDLHAVADAGGVANFLRAVRPRSVLAVLDERDTAAFDRLTESDVPTGFILGDTDERLARRFAKLMLFRALQASPAHDALVAPDATTPEETDHAGLRTFSGNVPVSTLRSAITGGQRILGLSLHADGYSGHLAGGALCARAGDTSGSVPLSCYAGPLCGRLGKDFAMELTGGSLVAAAQVRCELLLGFTCCGIRLHGPLGSAGTLGSRLMDNDDVGQILTTVGLVQSSPRALRRAFCAVYAGVPLGTLSRWLNAESRAVTAESALYVLLGDPLWSLPAEAPRPAGDGGAWEVRRTGRREAFGAVVPREEPAGANPVPGLPAGAFFHDAGQIVLCTSLHPRRALRTVDAQEVEARVERLEALLLRVEFLAMLVPAITLDEGDEEAAALARMVADASLTLWATLHETEQLRRIVAQEDEFDAPLAIGEEAARSLSAPLAALLARYARVRGGMLVQSWGARFRSVPVGRDAMACPHCGAAAVRQIRCAWGNPQHHRRVDQCVDCAVIVDASPDLDLMLDVSHREVATGSRLTARLTCASEPIDDAFALLETLPRGASRMFTVAARTDHACDFELAVPDDCPPGYATISVIAVASGAVAVLGPRILVRSSQIVRPPRTTGRAEAVRV